MHDRAVSPSGCGQRTKQGARAVPKDLDADANEKEGRKAQDDAHAAFADGGGETICESVASVNAHRDERGTNDRGENREKVRAEMMRLVGAERDGHGNGTRSNR